MEEKSRVSVVEDPAWFAMSATFGRALKAKTFLESKQVKCFVPMRYEIVKNKAQGKIRKLVPAINNLIFAYTTKERIQKLKSSVEFLQYLTKPVCGKNIPIIVPECQMQQFMAVCDTYNENLTYLSPGEINIKKGTPIKIVGGEFDGIEGTFVKVKNSRKKRVVVMIQGLTAVMIAEIEDGYLQVLE